MLAIGVCLKSDHALNITMVKLAVQLLAAGMPQPTIEHKWNWWACVAYTLMWAALVFYFYVRIRCCPFLPLYTPFHNNSMLRSDGQPCLVGGYSIPLLSADCRATACSSHSLPCVLTAGSADTCVCKVTKTKSVVRCARTAWSLYLQDAV